MTVTSSAPTIRLAVAPALPAQRDAIIALWRAAGLTTAWNNPENDFVFAAGKANSDILAGALDGKIVASVMVGHDGHRGWLYYAGVDPDFQKLGFGAEIIAAGEAWLRARGVPKVMLMVRDTNTIVEDFYKRLDYETIPRIVMQKWLKPPV